MSAYIVPFLFVTLLLSCAFKKKSAYNAMLAGAKKGAENVVNLFPHVMTIILALKLLQAGGLDQLLSKIASPLLTKLGIPQELTYLVVLRPLSGSGSIAMLSDILSKYGADSFVGRCACMIVDGSDTVFYMAGIYFAKTKVKNVWLVILCALFVSLVGAVLGCALCRLL